MEKLKALSVRQPYAEAIMLRIKKIEYRSIPTNIRGKIYIYASMTPGDKDIWDACKLEPGDLPTGVILGTVELVDCKDKTGNAGNYEWLLKNPKPLKKPIRPNPDQKAQPVWFYPFGKP